MRQFFFRNWKYTLRTLKEWPSELRNAFLLIFWERSKPIGASRFFGSKKVFSYVDLFRKNPDIPIFPRLDVVNHMVHTHHLSRPTMLGESHKYVFSKVFADICWKIQLCTVWMAVGRSTEAEKLVSVWLQNNSLKIENQTKPRISQFSMVKYFNTD